MSEELLNQVIKLAHTHKSLDAVSRAVGVETGMLRYHLAKLRRLDEVKAILRSNLKRFQ